MGEKTAKIAILILLYLFSAEEIHSQGQIIRITSPNGGENWEGMSVHYITWESSNIAKLKIEFSFTGSSHWYLIGDSVDALSGRFPWKLPNSGTADFLVRISDVSNPIISDINDKQFRIFIKKTGTKTSSNMQKLSSLTTSNTVKIMPLGDSITRGDGDDPTYGFKTVGYREKLYFLLDSAGYNFKLVGNDTTGYDNFDIADIPPSVLDFYNFGRQHEGHGGWVADRPSGVNSIENNVVSWLNSLVALGDKPHVILLKAGINDYF